MSRRLVLHGLCPADIVARAAWAPRPDFTRKIKKAGLDAPAFPVSSGLFE